MKSKNKFFKHSFFIIILLFIPTLEVHAETSNYINEKNPVLTMSQKDEIEKIGEELSSKGVELIFETRLQNNREGNDEAKDVFYSYLKKDQRDNKIIVFVYYIEQKEFEFYDDYGIVKKNNLDTVAKYMKKYHTNNKLDEGIMFSYKSLSKDLNKTLNLNSIVVDNLKVENIYKQSIFAPKNFIGMLIVIVLLFGFRRNKSMNII